MERHQRLKKFIDHKDLNQKDFAALLNSTQQYVSALLNGKRKLGSNLLERIESQFDELNIHWLLTGEGEMLKAESQKGENEQAFNKEPANEEYLALKAMHADLKKDLEEMAKGMTRNFEVVSEGIIRGLKDQQKVLEFIKQLDAKEISTASKGLKEFLKEKKE